jgi:hypothetical protein
MTLSDVAMAIGIVHGVVGLSLLISPGGTRKAVKAFPRHVWSGRILAALDMAWSVYLVQDMPLGWFDAYKGWLYVAGPILYGLIVLFMEELLAARALGGLLLLVASPILEAAAFRTESLRLVVVVMAYAWVLAGMALVLAPYRFRKSAEVLVTTTGRCRGLGGLVLAFGIVLVGLGWRVF